MVNNKIGIQTIKFDNKPIIVSTHSVVGKKEGEGPLKEWFDDILQDDFCGEKTWEKAESKMLKTAASGAISKSGRDIKEIDVMLSGDLLNQLMSSSFTARDLGIPFLGLYGACSTMSESLVLGSILIDGGYANNIIASTSSHFCTAERQFRMPLEHGNQRKMSAQWTVTGCGAALISNQGIGPQITHATIGKIIDLGVKDANMMGAAMAPAAVDTIYTHLKDTGRQPDFYDLIVTGDLGEIGKEITLDLMRQKGYYMESVYNDCGIMIFDNENQDTHSGGSGCGCSASVFCGYVYKNLVSRNIKNVLLVSTGALLSTISPLQGESIPGIAHAVAVTIQ